MCSEGACDFQHPVDEGFHVCGLHAAAGVGDHAYQIYANHFTDKSLSRKKKEKEMTVISSQSTKKSRRRKREEEEEEEEELTLPSK